MKRRTVVVEMFIDIGDSSRARAAVRRLRHACVRISNSDQPAKPDWLSSAAEQLEHVADAMANGVFTPPHSIQASR